MSRAQSSFKAAEQLRQANFRDTSATISESARRGCSPHRFLLAPGCSPENLCPAIRNMAIQFFEVRGIHWWCSKTSGDDPGKNLPTHNMTSSQVACVNFLLPLALNRAALLAVLNKIEPGVDDVVSIGYEGLSSLVDFEWTGAHKSLEGTKPTRGANVTSADALVIGSVKGQRRAFIFEWKYTEAYSANARAEKTSGDTRLRRYGELYSSATSSFGGNVRLEDLLVDPIYQIIRLILLADRMVQTKELEVSDARVVVVCPKQNTAYRETIPSKSLKALFPGTTGIYDVIRAALRDSSMLITISPDELLDAALKSSDAANLREWSAYERERYGY